MTRVVPTRNAARPLMRCCRAAQRSAKVRASCTAGKLCHVWCQARRAPACVSSPAANRQCHMQQRRAQPDDFNNNVDPETKFAAAVSWE